MASAKKGRHVRATYEPTSPRTRSVMSTLTTGLQYSPHSLSMAFLVVENPETEYLNWEYVLRVFGRGLSTLFDSVSQLEPLHKALCPHRGQTSRSTRLAQALDGTLVDKDGAQTLARYVRKS